LLCISIQPSVHLSTRLPVCLSFYPFIYPNKRLCIIHLPPYAVIIVIIIIIITNELSQRATHSTFISEVPRLDVGHNKVFPIGFTWFSLLPGNAKKTP
jgi:Fe2+ transport system protein B